MRLFERTGAHVLVDGQFGSTGKGALASYLAMMAVQTGAIDAFQGAISSSGPNSGHTSWYGQEKIVLKQLPTFAVHAQMAGAVVPAYLSAGAVIDPEILAAEARRFPNLPIFVHPNAAIVSALDKAVEQDGTIRDIASTQSGTGAALARKIYRDPKAIARESLRDMPPNVAIMNHRIKPERSAYFVEVAQGFSLGINSEFYPHVTSRECTVMQAIADARIPPRLVSKTYMCIRTFPIRVGHLGEHMSGDWYDDQQEVEWSDIGVEPELTTVTKRIRRVATFSESQLVDAIRANDPDWIGINFLNYLDADAQRMMISNLKDASEGSDKPFGIIAGVGPNAMNWSAIL